MKNRRKIMKVMKTGTPEYKFSISELANRTSLKPSQIDYEIKLMLAEKIVDRIGDLKDMRRAYYIHGKNFQEAFEND